MSKGLKLVILGTPLAGAAITTCLPIHLIGQQFLMLIVLLWIQVFFIVECFLFSK